MNLGNPEEFSILELAELVIELTGSRSRMTFRPLPGDDPTQRCPDIALARRELGWQPRVGLREGLRRSIEHLERVLSRGDLAPAGKARAPRKGRLAAAAPADGEGAIRVRVSGGRVSDAPGR